ncbi:MAG: hypothetical protein ACI8XM_000244 [Haloarculaceae archaeon]|jgi:hypothetical protein
MSLDTETEVEEIRTVTDDTGAKKSPSNTAEQQRIAAAVENQPDVGAFEHATAGTAAESLPANPVPQGVKVLVQARPGNTDPVYVGDSTAQPAIIKGTKAVTLKVTDTSAIYIQTPTAGDSVGVLFEEA